MIRCIVIDDEEMARRLLEKYIAKIPNLKLMDSFENPLEALTLLSNDSVDLVFLDIQMPEIKGTDFARSIHKNVKIIFTTAYSEYALEGFELSAMDYLLKPITFNRFLAAVQKYPEVKDLSSETTISIKSGYDLIKVPTADIRFIMSESEYVTYFLKDRKIMSYNSLKSLEIQLDSSNFMRVHRSYIVNKSFISGISGRNLLLGDTKVPVSKTYLQQVRKEFDS